MKAIFTTLCGCSQMLDIPQEDIRYGQVYRLPMHSRYTSLRPLPALPVVEYGYREFDFDEALRVNGRLVVHFIEKWKP
jgi:hypothetical protein